MASHGSGFNLTAMSLLIIFYWVLLLLLVISYFAVEQWARAAWILTFGCLVILGIKMLKPQW